MTKQDESKKPQQQELQEELRKKKKNWKKMKKKNNLFAKNVAFQVTLQHGVFCLLIARENNLKRKHGLDKSQCD